MAQRREWWQQPQAVQNDVSLPDDAVWGKYQGGFGSTTASRKLNLNRLMQLVPALKGLGMPDNDGDE